MKYKILFTGLILSCFTFFSFGQMKVVVMGSSTAYGVGASTYSNSWVGLTENYLNQNTSDGLDTIFYNIARPGYDTYQEMPTTYTPPPGRPLPDDSFNVTRALSFNPDIVIINLPSNDVNYGYAKSETMSNFRTMFSTISATGAKCYITTPQPRNDLSQNLRDTLFSLVDSVTLAFGAYAVNFWNPLVTPDTFYMLRDEYRAIPSPLHVNDSGHYKLFEVIRDNIFHLSPVALQLTSFQGQMQNNAVLLKWHTEQQGANTSFQVERSSNGQNFETVLTQSVNEARQSADYSGVDQTPFSGKSFYRLKIIEPNRQTYSSIISVTSRGKVLSLSNISTTSSSITADVNIQRSHDVNFSIVSMAGAVLLQQKIFIMQPAGKINIPVGNLAGGQYYLRISTIDGANDIQAFTK